MYSSFVSEKVAAPTAIRPSASVATFSRAMEPMLSFMDVVGSWRADGGRKIADGDIARAVGFNLAIGGCCPELDFPVFEDGGDDRWNILRLGGSRQGRGGKQKEYGGAEGIFHGEFLLRRLSTGLLYAQT